MTIVDFRNTLFGSIFVYVSLYLLFMNISIFVLKDVYILPLNLWFTSFIDLDSGSTVIVSGRRSFLFSLSIMYFINIISLSLFSLRKELSHDMIILISNISFQIFRVLNT